MAKEESPPSATHVQWEYKRRSYGGGSTPTDEELKRLGLDGWEMCGVRAGTAMHTYFFKRPLR